MNIIYNKRIHFVNWFYEFGLLSSGIIVVKLKAIETTVSVKITSTIKVINFETNNKNLIRREENISKIFYR